MTIFSRAFIEEAGVRAVRTFAQGMLAVIGGSAFDVWSADWKNAVGVGASAAVLSLLMSLDRGEAVGSTTETGVTYLDGEAYVGCGENLRGY